MSALTSTPERILRNIRFQAVAQGYGALVNLFLPILVVHLTITGTRLYQVGMVLWVIFRVISDWGTGTLCIRDVAQDRSRLAAYQRAQMTVRLLASGACLLAILVIARLLYAREPDTRAVAACFGVTLVLETIAEGYRWIFRATQRMGRDAVVAVVERTAVLCLTALAAFVLRSVLACAAAAALAQAVSLATALLLSRPLRKSAGEAGGGGGLLDGAADGHALALRRMMWRVGPSFMAMGATWILYSRIDYLILDAWPTVSDVDVGLYGLAYMPLKGLLMIPELVMLAMFPAFAELHRNDLERLSVSARAAFRYLVGGTLGLALLGAIVSPLVATLMLALHRGGEDTHLLAPLIALLLLSAPLYTVTSICGHLLAATGRQLQLSGIYLLALSFNVAGNVVFAIPRHGAIGCAAMTIATEALLSNGLVFSLGSPLSRRLRWPTAAATAAVTALGATCLR